MKTMNIIYPEKLISHIKLKGLKKCYLLYGNEPYFLYECKKNINIEAAKKNFIQHFIFFIDHNTNWDKIFNHFKNFDFFYQKKVLFLILPDILTSIIINNLLKIFLFLHEDIVVIFKINILKNLKKNKLLFLNIIKYSFIIPCMTLNLEKMSNWLNFKIKDMGFISNKLVNDTLCHYYEGNLSALSQILHHFSILWTDKQLTLLRVEKIINHSSYFTPFQWIDALFFGNYQRAIKILLKFKKQEHDIFIVLVYLLRKELIKFLFIKRKYKIISENILYNNTEKHTLKMYKKAIFKINNEKILKLLKILNNIDISLKKENFPIIFWDKLEKVSFLICQFIKPF